MHTFHDPHHWLEITEPTLAASPLYSAFWQGMKQDSELLALLDRVGKHQPLPITFFTAINYLVLGEPDTPLARFYSYLQPEETWPASGVYPVFRDFVLAHREMLKTLLPTARLQTNEVTRCANLLPAFSWAYQHGGYQQLNMIEIGASAGLNLRWFQYGYRYVQREPTQAWQMNDPTVPVQVCCEVQAREGFPLSSFPTMPRVVKCQGIELMPRDLHNAYDVRWLRASIWPEELERYRLLDTALAFARTQPIIIHPGDACDILPALLSTIPARHTAVVWHSFSLNQGPPEVKEKVIEQIAHASWGMPIYRIGLEVEPEARLPLLTFFEYREGRVVTQEVMACCALHGEHMTWMSSF